MICFCRSGGWVVGVSAAAALQLPLNYQVLYTEPVCFVARPHYPLAARAQIALSDPGALAVDSLANRHPLLFASVLM